MLRWFGILRKRNGKYVFATREVREFPDQSIFLRDVLKMERGDVVIELLQNDVWQPRDFSHYCVETYLREKSSKSSESTKRDFYI